VLRQQIDAEEGAEPVAGVGGEEAQGIQRALGPPLLLLLLHMAAPDCGEALPRT